MKVEVETVQELIDENVALRMLVKDLVEKVEVDKEFMEAEPERVNLKVNDRVIEIITKSKKWYWKCIRQQEIRKYVPFEWCCEKYESCNKSPVDQYLNITQKRINQIYLLYGPSHLKSISPLQYYGTLIKKLYY